VLIKVSIQLLEIFQLVPFLFSVECLYQPCINILLPLLTPPTLDIVVVYNIGILDLKNPSPVSYALPVIVVFRTDIARLGVKTSLFVLI